MSKGIIKGNCATVAANGWLPKAVPQLKPHARACTEHGSHLQKSDPNTVFVACEADCTMLVVGLQSSKGERTMKVKGRDLLLM
jgi:hypothetical protein